MDQTQIDATATVCAEDGIATETTEQDPVPKKDDSPKAKTFPISKNQAKKLLRNADWERRRMEKRLREREKRKLKKQQERDEKALSGEPADDGELHIKRRRMNDPLASDIRVAIDCTYDDLMNDFEIKKLCKQIQRCYSENRNVSNVPLQLHICGLAGRFKELSDHVIAGYRSWDVHWKTEGPEAVFGRDNLVYLTAESPNILTELKPDRVYIIGGLVDHNHHKGHCFSLAEERGWSHAQLPISEYVLLRDRKVLTINHVFEILLAFVKTKDWKTAFMKVLPQRKVAAIKESPEVKGERSKEDAAAKEEEKEEEEVGQTTDK